MAQLTVSPYLIRILLQYVREMREAQREYFKSKSATWLQYAIKRERMVDRLLGAIEDEAEEYKSLRAEIERMMAEQDGV
jgi:predicted  nucleic acid-binding Zn-ribbon protein